MCFSATASFLASGSIATFGIATKPKVKHKNDYPLAAIPFVFAIQQAIEGFVWLSLSSSNLTCLTYTFVFFAYLFWPSFAPIAFYFHERDEGIRRYLRFFIALGLFTSFYLAYFLYKNGLNFFVVNNNHLAYYYDVYGSWWVMLTYFVASVGPAMLSSSKVLRMFGWALSASYLISLIFYVQALFSVWCFFAAVLSVIIFWHFKTAEIISKPKAKVKIA